jgi:hypothetical protein
MKKLLILIFLFNVLLVPFNKAHAQDVGLFFRTDCATLSPVAHQTLCFQLTTVGSLTQGVLYKYTGTWQQISSGTGDFSDLTGVATDAQIPNNITIDLAALATALAANGANCAAGSFPLGTDASGAAEDCTDAATQAELNAFVPATATALASNPTDCATGAYANAIAASGNLTCQILLVSASVAPDGATDDTTLGYIVGTIWIDTAEPAVYVASDVTDGAAIWNLIYPATAAAESDTLQTVFGRGDTITGANSFANAACIGDGTDAVCVYIHATDGPQVVCSIGGVEGVCNRVIKLLSTYLWAIKNAAGTTLVSVTEANVRFGMASPVAMRLDAVEDGDNNAQALPVFGTNLNYATVRYVDAATGVSYWSAYIPEASTQWNMVLHNKPASGTGTAVSLEIYCRTVANNVALDSTVTYIQGASANPAEITVSTTSANLNVNVIAATMALAKRDRLICGIKRVGGDANDNLSASWDLLGVTLEINQ